jgi:acyl-coenzyme A synthetase/AMP-(fatty) acid ligase
MIKGPEVAYPEKSPLELIRAVAKKSPKAVAGVLPAVLTFKDLDLSSLSALVDQFGLSMPWCKYECYEPKSIDDPLYLTFTSGSTGFRHGVLRTGRNVVSRMAWELIEGPQIIYPMNSSLAHVLVTLIAGQACVRLEPGRLGAMVENIAEVLKVYKAVQLTVLPQFVSAFTDRALPLGSLRTLTSLGAPISPEVAARFRQRFSIIELVDGYGSGETGYAMLDGLPVANTTLEVVDGRLQVSGPGVSYGYNDGRVFNGTFHTLDRAREVNGKIELLGRAL